MDEWRREEMGNFCAIHWRNSLLGILNCCQFCHQEGFEWEKGILLWEICFRGGIEDFRI
jgi:hypothetical protein